MWESENAREKMESVYYKVMFQQYERAPPSEMSVKALTELGWLQLVYCNIKIACWNPADGTAVLLYHRVSEYDLGWEY